MTFRVPSFAYSQRAIHYSTQQSGEILKYQEQISSGLRFQSPSDEPLAYRRATSLRSRHEELTADQTTINQSTSILNASVSQIQDYNSVFVRAKTLTQQGIQALDSDEREALALEVDGLLDQLKGISLSQFGNRYLYGGTKSGQPPFEFSQPDTVGGVLNVEYLGSDQRSRASVSDSITIDTYYDGADVFGARGRQDTVLVGQTGAKTGAGTDSMIGHTTLQVTHGTTTYQGGSGVAAGTDSDAKDTILGLAGAHTLTIEDTAGDGSSGTISLNGGSEVTFSNTDTNLEIIGPNGQVVYLDTTNITAGFAGTVDIDSTGFLSVDNGQTRHAIDFSSSQVVVHSSSDQAVTIDSSAIRNVGNDHLEFPGTSDAFQVLHSLAADLRNERGLSDDQLAKAMNRKLGELDKLAENAFEVLGEQSTSLRTLEALDFRVQDLIISVESQISDVQATDLPDAVVRLENAQALLRYNFAVSADLLQIGILQFLT